MNCLWQADGVHLLHAVSNMLLLIFSKFCLTFMEIVSQNMLPAFYEIKLSAGSVDPVVGSICHEHQCGLRAVIRVCYPVGCTQVKKHLVFRDYVTTVLLTVVLSV